MTRSDEGARFDRRRFLGLGLATAGAMLLGGGACERDRPSVSAARADACDATEDNIEGPYYRAGAPERGDLVAAGIRGTVLVLSGVVRSLDCAPLPHARLEIWQADADGAYDLRGNTLRATLVADDQARFRLRTIVPGHYRNGSDYRPAHIHVKVHAPRHRSLTTQLYFEGDPYNAEDPFIRESLILAAESTRRGLRASRDLVLVPA